MQSEAAAGSRAWHEIVLAVLKANDVRLVPYVPDNVLKPLINAVHADPFFTAFATAREEEAIGIVCGAWMAGTRGIVLMQTSGFATLANVLASLPCAFQIPALMMISERGTLGEFNIGQAMVWRTMRPVLEALGMEHHVISRLDECEFICDRTIKQAVMTQQPAALILSPLLTGGKVVNPPKA
ncbi:MAG: decarboxylase [Acetobacteraceae bacterium]|nr:decarboxylase [Acetobacteraceae bacterium]MDI3306070.1 decarboxylase [Acetobacteraceae bacterium]